MTQVHTQGTLEVALEVMIKAGATPAQIGAFAAGWASAGAGEVQAQEEPTSSEPTTATTSSTTSSVKANPHDPSTWTRAAFERTPTRRPKGADVGEYLEDVSRSMGLGQSDSDWPNYDSFNRSSEALSRDAALVPHPRKVQVLEALRRKAGVQAHEKLPLVKPKQVLMTALELRLEELGKLERGRKAVASSTTSQAPAQAAPTPKAQRPLHSAHDSALEAALGWKYKNGSRGHAALESWASEFANGMTGLLADLQAKGQPQAEHERKAHGACACAMMTADGQFLSTCKFAKAHAMSNVAGTVKTLE